MSMIRIGLAQCRQTSDFEDNSKTIFRFLEDAAAAEVQIVCFPETQTVGYRVDVASSTSSYPVPIEALSELHRRVAERCGELGMACILGTETPLDSDPENGKPYNSALVINEKGSILGVHHKTRLTPLDLLVYTPGSTFETFDLFGVRVGVVICFEAMRFAETTAECARQGAQLVFHPQNNTTRPADWKIPIHHAMIVTRAAENTIWFASCNCCYPEHQKLPQPDRLSRWPDSRTNRAQAGTTTGLGSGHCPGHSSYVPMRSGSLRPCALPGPGRSRGVPRRRQG